jgi:hypothetical protein
MNDPVNQLHSDRSGKHRRSVIERFWQNVHRKQDHQCWHWIGSKAVRGGYGQLNDRGTVLKAHRLSWEINLGIIPNGMLVRHLCHNPSCCNPSHLLPGTPQDNHDDMRKAGRMFIPPCKRGEKAFAAKLTENQVLAIYSSKERGVDLASKHGVTPSMISRIRCGRAWRHATNHLIQK